MILGFCSGILSSALRFCVDLRIDFDHVYSVSIEFVEEYLLPGAGRTVKFRIIISSWRASRISVISFSFIQYITKGSAAFSMFFIFNVLNIKGFWPYLLNFSMLRLYLLQNSFWIIYQILISSVNHAIQIEYKIESQQQNHKMQVKTLLFLFAIIYLSQSAPPKLAIYIGRGYDLLRGNPLTDKVDPGFEHQIFNFTYNDNKVTADNRYLVPDSISQVQSTSCSFSSDVNSYRGTQSYQDQLKTKASVGGGYDGLVNQASFSASFGYTQMQKFATEMNYTFTQATAECEAYRLSMNIFKYDPLLPNFVQGVIQSYNNKNWSRFIDQFGTHFVYTTTMGGRATQQISYSSQSISKMNSMGIQVAVAAKAKFAKFYGDASFDFSKQSEAISYSQQYSSTTKEFYVGGQVPKDGNTKTWAASVANTPMPLIYDLGLLSDLFKQIKNTGFDAAQAETQFKQALDRYCTSINCKAPSADKGNPPPVIYAEMRTLQYGQTAATPFQWKISAPATMSLKSILLRSGRFVDNIQLVFTDSVKTEYSPAIGGSGGSAYTWNIPKGEYVSQVEFRTGTGLDSIAFITNKGSRSEKRGGDGGSYSLLTIPDGYQIVGFFGATASNVERLGFILAKTIFPKSYDPVTLETNSNPIGNPINTNYPGSNFSWKAANYVYPVYIGVSFRDYLEAIRMIVSNNQRSPDYGNGSKYGFYDWPIPAGQNISKIEYYYGSVIDSLTFIMSNGERSQKFGGNGGKLYVETIPQGYRLIGLFGNAGRYVNQLGFYLAKAVTPGTQQQHTLVRRHLLRQHLQ